MEEVEKLGEKKCSQAFNTNLQEVKINPSINVIESHIA